MEKSHPNLFTMRNRCELLWSVTVLLIGDWDLYYFTYTFPSYIEKPESLGALQAL